MTAPDMLREQLTRLVDDPPTVSGRLDDVRRRARRMRRNRVAATVASAAAVVAAVFVGTTIAGVVNRSAPIDPLAPPATKLPTGVLLVNGNGVVSQLPAMTDRALQPVRDLRLEPNGPPIPVAGGKALATDASRDWLLVDPRRPGSARLLLRAAPVSPATNIAGEPGDYVIPFDTIPGVGPRLILRVLVERGGARVWLVTATRAELSRISRPYTLYAMDLTGHIDPKPVHVPVGIEPVVAGAAGIYGDGFSNHRGALVRIDRNGKVEIAKRSSFVDWSSTGYGEAFVGPDCSTGCQGDLGLSLLDADTGRLTPIGRAPHGGGIDMLPPVFSVDGRYAAVPLTQGLPLRATGNDIDSGIGWVVVDVRTGATTLIPGSLRYGVRTQDVFQRAGWSGDRLIWIEDLRHGESIVGAYLPVNGRSVITRVQGHGLSLVGAS